MKMMKKTLILLLCCIAVCAQAQNMGQNGMTGGRMGRGGPPRDVGVERKPMTSQEMAQKETDWMNEKLKLTAEQLPKVSAINQRFAAEKVKTFQEMRASGTLDETTLRNTMAGVALAQDAELKTIFTDEQWKIFQKNKKKMRER
jgi:hypothetical protein